jgi:hypothetical protein
MGKTNTSRLFSGLVTSTTITSVSRCKTKYVSSYQDRKTNETTKHNIYSPKLLGYARDEHFSEVTIEGRSLVGCDVLEAMVTSFCVGVISSFFVGVCDTFFVDLFFGASVFFFGTKTRSGMVVDDDVDLLSPIDATLPDASESESMVAPSKDNLFDCSFSFLSYCKLAQDFT